MKKNPIYLNEEVAEKARREKEISQQIILWRLI